MSLPSGLRQSAYTASESRRRIVNHRSVRLFAGKKRERLVVEEVDDAVDEDDLYVVAASTADAANSLPSALASFATSYHAPVMCKECIEAMIGSTRATNDEDVQRPLPSPLVFVDGTLGGGGHSQALLETLRPGDVVFGCDVDPDALAVANQRLSLYAPNSSSNELLPWFVPVQSNFGDLTKQLLVEQLAALWNNDDARTSAVVQHFQENGLLVDGILLDLGVSSYQIDTAARGFAFMRDGPLDMRMNGAAAGHRVTAADLCNELDVPELRRIFTVYGDEPRARAVAESIAERRPLRTTAHLRAAVAAVTPQFARHGRRLGRTATLARVFQSLRIVVNQEDVALERALTKMAPALLRPDGRLVVLSYHSMEDRATKRVMRDGTVSKREAHLNNAQKDLYGNYMGTPKPFRAVGKPQKATAEEIALNARARSATLRVAERLPEA